MPTWPGAGAAPLEAAAEWRAQGRAAVNGVNSHPASLHDMKPQPRYLVQSQQLEQERGDEDKGRRQGGADGAEQALLPLKRQFDVWHGARRVDERIPAQL